MGGDMSTAVEYAALVGVALLPFVAAMVVAGVAEWRRNGRRTSFDARADELARWNAGPRRDRWRPAVFGLRPFIVPELRRALGREDSRGRRDPVRHLDRGAVRRSRRARVDRAPAIDHGLDHRLSSTARTTPASVSSFEPFASTVTTDAIVSASLS